MGKRIEGLSDARVRRRDGNIERGKERKKDVENDEETRRRRKMKELNLCLPGSGACFPALPFTQIAQGARLGARGPQSSQCNLSKQQPGSSIPYQ